MDKTRIFEAAGKFAAKGQLDKAVKEYQRVLDEDPKDVRALQKLAEIHQKSGKNKEASDLMLRVAEGYSDQGFFLKSVAVYKQVLKLGADRVDVNLKLAQIYQQLGLVSDATQQYQLVANFYDKAGNVRESLAALRKMVDLDPDNVESRRKLAELYARENMVGEAVTEFRRAAAYLKKANRAEDHLKVLDRVGQLLPDDAAVARELAQAFLSRGEAKRALAKLQVCFRQNPRDVETLQMLARAFQELGQAAKTVSVYRELVHVLAELGLHDQRRKVLEAILALVPGDPEATEQLRAPADGADAPLVPSPPSSAIVPPAPAQPSPSPAAIIPPAPRPAPAPAPAPVPAPSPRASGSPGPSAGAPLPAAVQKVLTEVDVYLKYNLLPKATEHLRRALADAPDSIAVQEKRLVLADKLGQASEALETLTKLISLARAAGDLDRESSFLQDLGQRAPDHPLVTEAAAAAELDELDLDSADVVVEPDADDEDGAPVLVGTEDDGVTLDVDMLSASPSAAPPAPTSAAPAFDRNDLADSADDESVIVEEDEEGSDAALGLALDAHEPLPPREVTGSRRSEIDPFRLDDDDADPGDAVVLDDDGDDVEPIAVAAAPTTGAVPDFGLGPAPRRTTPPPAPPAPAPVLPDFGEVDTVEEEALAIDEGPPAPVAVLPDSFVTLESAAPSEPAVPVDEASPVVEDEDGPSAALPLQSATEPVAAPPAPEPVAAAPAPETVAEASAPEPVAAPEADTSGTELEGDVPSVAAAGLPESASDTGDGDEDEFVPVPGPRPKSAAAVVAPPSPPPEQSVPPPEPVPDFAAELDEAEFLVAQGLSDDARFALEAILAQAPDHVRARELLEIIDPPAQSAAPREPTMPPPGALPPRDEGFDLAKELADEFDFFDAPRLTTPGEAGVSVSEVLSGLSGTPDATHEDAQTHYDLGIAYKEMGLLDEAIQEFEVALKATGRRRVIDCLNMIGLCRLEKGNAAGALDAFSKALKTPGITLEASKELHYELGRCQEALGDFRKALDHVGRVMKADPGFRDVKASVARLQARIKASGVPAPAKVPAVGAGKAVPGRPSQTAAASAGKKPETKAPAAVTRPANGSAPKTDPAAAPEGPESKPPAGGRGGKIGYV